MKVIKKRKGRPKKPFNLKSWLIPRLRNVSKYWPAKNQCINAAKVITDAGVYLNGKPKTKVKFKCSKCGELFDREMVEVDHIDPISNLDGFVDWNTYIEKLFCSIDNLQLLCVGCHREKTNDELMKRLSKKD